MPSQQRGALYLVYGEGASYDEAAEIVGLNIMALMKVLSRAHLALGAWLDQRSVTQAQPQQPVAARVAEKAA
jgi:RNA polymerase sigma-70 factor (ECF subfamily)